MKRYRLREEMNGIAEPPGKVWFWELEAGVIHADRCIQCGTCVAVCPSNSIGVDEDTDLPELVKMCTGCSLCWDFCPRGGLRYEALWPPSTVDGDEDAEVQPAQVRSDSSDTYWKITGGPPGRRARRGGRAATPCGPAAQIDDAQDGGAVSALLIGLLAAGEIDGALVSKPSPDPDEQWKGVATIATTRGRDPGGLGQLLQPDDGAGRAGPVAVQPCRPSRGSPSSARRARCRGSGPCRPGAGPRAPTGSTRSC